MLRPLPHPTSLTTLAPRGRAFGASAPILLSLYLLVLVASPVLHHDFACHQRSPVHCQACLAHPPAPPAPDVATLTLTRLLPAEAIVGTIEAKRTWAAGAPLPGRSPPLA
jgi:hypothetical protein